MSLSFQNTEQIIRDYFIEGIDFEKEYRNIKNQLEWLQQYHNDGEIEVLLSEIRLNCPQIFK